MQPQITPRKTRKPRPDLSERNRTHGLSKTPEYKVWSGIVARCTIPTATGYQNYGGRGITICERWRSFENFLADMGPRPTPKHEVDRINGELDYSPENCKWATRREQQQHTRRTVLVTYQDETLTVAEWARRVGIHPCTLGVRIRRGWSLERAMTEPIHI